MTAKRRPDRRFLIPAVGIALVLLLVLLRPVSLARPEAQNPTRDRWVGYYMVYQPIADSGFDADWETYGDTKILNAQRQSDGRYAFTGLEGQALFFEFLPPTDPEDPDSAVIAFQSDVADAFLRTDITEAGSTEALSGTLYFGPATTPAPGGMAPLGQRRQRGGLRGLAGKRPAADHGPGSLRLAAGGGCGPGGHRQPRQRLQPPQRPGRRV